MLVRSALGRVVAILGLVAITSVLGYLAIAIPAAGGLGNLPFLAMMVGLTLVAVVAAVFHPIAWTDEEMRLAVIAPAALGALIFFGALALGRLDATLALGPVSGHAVAGGDRAGGGLARGLRPVPAGRRPRLRPAGGRGRPERPRPGPGATGTGSDRLAAAWRLRGPAARVGRGLPGGDPGRRLRRELHPVGADREPPPVGRRPRRPHRPDAARSHLPDVRLSQQPVLGPRGIVAVVGLAVRPEARVVLPGQHGRAARARRSTTRATSSSGGWACRP